MKKKVLVTGSSGLIGSEAVQHFDKQGCAVWGVDNNSRKEFFGEKGDTTWNLRRLLDTTSCFHHLALDVRDRPNILALFEREIFDIVIHCAAQPSHDKAREIPFIDFDINAVGTLNLLEAVRQHAPHAIFILMSTNKVYGDAPNEIPLKETETRFDFERTEDYHGVPETCRVDQCLHSLFGASKAAADILAQEYRAVLRTKGGCLPRWLSNGTGPLWSRVTRIFIVLSSLHSVWNTLSHLWFQREASAGSDS